LQSADLRERVDRAEGAREVFQRSRVPHADPMYRQAPICPDGYSFAGKLRGKAPATDRTRERSEDRAAKLACAVVQELVA
jgi:hypothetical protein